MHFISLPNNPMKSFILIFLLLQMGLMGFSQEQEAKLGISIREANTKSLKIESLQTAQSMHDINPGYPKTWISEEDYISAEILASCKGEIQKAVGKNEILNSAQRNLLKKADLGSEIAVEVKYKSKNMVTQEAVVNTMKFSLMLVPEIQAKFPGGQKAMQRYLEMNTLDKVPASLAKELEEARVSFIVNKEGKTSHIKISKSSKDKKIDELLLKVVRDMPIWEAAKTSKCMKIDQKFELVFGNKFSC